MSSKDLARSVVRNVAGTKFLSSIETYIDSADVVSFDIFDTLVRRSVGAPAGVFDVVADLFEKRTGRRIEGYREARIAAERRAREATSQEEITYDEIFDQLGMLSKDDIAIMKELEIEAELSVCYADQTIKPAFDYALDHGKHVVITSDMYLPRSAIEAILHKCGYTGWEWIYLSSEMMLTKHSGSMFVLVREDWPADASIIHIGDNPRGDMLSTRSHGIIPVLIKPAPNGLTYWDKPGERVPFEEARIRAFLESDAPRMHGFAEHLGEEVLGPMLLGFSLWLHEKANEEGIEKLVFLSREGKLLKDAYELLFPDDSLLHEYLYASRRAVLIPQLSHATCFTDMIDTIKPFLRSDILSTLCEVCEVDRKDFDRGLASLGLNTELPFGAIDIGKREKVLSLIMALGGDEYREQDRLIREYLDACGIKGRIGIVDIGYSGTMQIALQKFLGNSADLRGLYLGVHNVDRDDCYVGVKRAGYLYEPGYNDQYRQLIRFSTEAFEFLFLNPVGSVDGYARSGNEVVPVLGASEYSNDARSLAESIQSSALDFVSHFVNGEDVSAGFHVAADVAIKPYYNFASHPNRETIEVFRGIKYLNGTAHELVPKEHLGYFITHPGKFGDGLNKSVAKTFWLSGAVGTGVPWFELMNLASGAGIKSGYRKKYLS